MSQLEVYRAALSHAVHDGNAELVKILTRECFALIDQRTPNTQICVFRQDRKSETGR